MSDEMSEQQTRDEGRRAFLKSGAAAGAAAVATTLLPSGVLAAIDREPAGSAPRKKGYQLSQHVIDYYKSASL